jgi:phenylacetic acid degradation operon negative regulatory protein
VWIRPDNLDPQRLPHSRAVLAQQCVHFRGAHSDLSADTVRSLFSLDSWSRDASRLASAMDDELQAPPGDRDDASASLTYQFALSIAVVRHLQLDPLLPAPLLPEDWPAASLRSSYRRFDDAFKRRMSHAFRPSAG